MYRADFQYKRYKVMYEKHGKKLKLHIYFYTNIYTHVPSQISVQVKKYTICGGNKLAYVLQKF